MAATPTSLITAVATAAATSGRCRRAEVWLRPDVLDFQGEKPGPNGAYIHWLGKADRGQIEWGFRFYSRRSTPPNRISAYIWNPDGGEGAGAFVEEPLRPHRWIYLVATLDDPRQPSARMQLYKDGVRGPHNHSPGTRYTWLQCHPAPPNERHLGTPHGHATCFSAG